MARKPFKVVNDIDLSGNKLIDVREIYRSDYDGSDPAFRDILIRAGNDLTNNNEAGGSVVIRSGTGSARGDLKFLLGSGVGNYGLTILGSSATTLQTENQDVTIATGTAATKITSTVNSTGPGSGSVQIAGGVYIAKDLVLSGGNIIASTATTWNLLNTVATTVNAFGATTTLNIGQTGLGSTTVNIATAASTSGTKAINIGTNGTTGSTTTITIGTDAGTSPSVTLKGLSINLGTSTAAATTVTVGGSVTGNVLKIAGTASGTANISSDVTTGTVNLLTEITTGTVNIATGGASVIQIGGAGATLLLGGTTGTTTVNSQSGASVDLFPTPATITAFSQSTSLTIGKDKAGTTAIISDTFNVVNATSVSISSDASDAVSNHSISIGTSSADVNKTISIGTLGTGTTTITIGATSASSTTTVNGNIVLGDDASRSISLVGTITSAGFSIANASSYKTTILPGTNTSNISVTLPSTTDQYFTIGLRADGRIDMKSIMAGNGSTALSPSDGGILYSDANGFQILSGVATAGRVLISGANAAPTWTGGTLSIAASQSLTVLLGNITITNGQSATASTLTIPSGPLTFPEGIVAGDILYATGNGTLTRLAKAAAGSVLVSGDAPSWDANPSITSLTLSENLAVNGGTISSSASTFNLLNTTVITANVLGAATAITIGNDGSSASVIFPTTKNATSTTEAGVVISGGLGVAKAAYFGTTVDVAGATTLSSTLAVNGNTLSSSSATFNFLNATVTTLNMLGASGATLNIGANDTNTRAVNIYGDMNIGTSSKTRTINHYGTFNFGGPTGFKIEWNSDTNSLDFVKL